MSFFRIEILFFKTCCLTAFVIGLGFSANCQQFIAPYEHGIPLSKWCYVIKPDGQKLRGTAVSGFDGSRGIKSISMRDSLAKITSFNANEIVEIGFKNDALVKAIVITDRSESIKKLAMTDWDKLINPDYIVYRSVFLPKGNRKVLMQILNPEFDSKVEVFYSQGSRKTSGISLPVSLIAPVNSDKKLKLTGGLQRAYWVSKNKEKVIKVKRGNYNKKKFMKLFGDNPLMKHEFKRPYRIKNFAQHVFFYDQH